MAEESLAPDTSIQVCVRVRPLNGRELEEGHRTCVSFDEPSKQVVLTAVDKNTLIQLRGNGAKGYAFDKRYGQDLTSDSIYDGSVAQLVDSIFKGYNATVLAYGQTGSGKTHTMAGGVGIHGKREEGVIPRVVRHIFSLVDQLKKREKPGEKTEVSAYALELYNEDLRDLSCGAREPARDGSGWDAGKAAAAGTSLKLQERPVGKDGRVVPEVVGVRDQVVSSAEELHKVFTTCMENRSTSSTKLNDSSSRSHAIFTITIRRTAIEVTGELGADFKAKVRTIEFSSKLHLVDLAGSERVKRSGVTGAALKEATHINSGLLALGNVIVALSGEADGKKKGHVPYRDSKLTRLLQDSLGGNSLTVLISCISPSEQDFEETNNTLKYANRACFIKNTPLPNKFTMLEEDLLPCMPSAGGAMGMMQLQALLEEHENIKELREKRARDKSDKEDKRLAQLDAMREPGGQEGGKTPGFQRLRANQYDELRRQLTSSCKGSKGNTNISTVIGDDTLRGFGRVRVGGLSLTDLGASLPTRTPGRATAARTGRGQPSPGHNARLSSSMALSGTGQACGQTFDDWMAAQNEGEVGQGAGGAHDGGHLHHHGDAGDDDFFEQEAGDDGDFLMEDGADEADGEGSFLMADGEEEEDDADVTAEQRGSSSGAHPGADASTSSFLADRDDGAPVTPSPAVDCTPAAAAVGKNKFRRGAAAPKAVAGLIPDDDDGVLRGAGRGATGEQHATPSGATARSASGDGALPTPAAATLAEEDEGVDEFELVDPIVEVDVPRLLARFRVNPLDTLAVFKAVTKEDFRDVIGLLPENTPLPASDKMTYLLARLEVHTAGGRDMDAALQRVGNGELSMNAAVGPAVGCLMATFGTNMISSCIFEFDDPTELKYYTVEERIELWGLQIPHLSVRPTLQAAEEEGGGAAAAAAAASESKGSTITWTSVDRLNMSIGLLYALCNHANENGIRCGFCVPRPQLLKRWLQAGVKMKSVATSLKLIYPSSAHDYEYYKASTVAFFMVREVQAALEKVLGIIKPTGAPA